MNTEAFQQLIRVLEEVQDQKKPFDLTTWWTDDPHDCGTAACAVGWAARDPWFQARGLGATAVAGRTANYPFFDRYEGWDAVTNFFDITQHEADCLFDIEGYSSSYDEEILSPTPQEVINQIQSFMEYDGMSPDD